MQRSVIVLVSLIVAVALFAPPGAQAQQAPIRVYVDGQPVAFDVPPTVIEGRVLVPLRGIFERLGATVDYDPGTQHIVALRGPQTVELTIGSRQAHVNSAATLLDVPAFTIAGRTMVPLRFISESLGANVQWVDASRIILIGSTGASPPPPAPGAQAPPPPAPQPAQGQTISGRLMSVAGGAHPHVVVRSNGQDYTIAVLPETAIFRYNVQSRAGGSSPLSALQAGDRVTVDVNGQMQAAKITAEYRVAAAGRIATVNGRTVTLGNGQSFAVLRDARITLNGQDADFSALQNGRNARFLIIEGTNQAYEVNVTGSPAQAPAQAPAAVTAPSIAAPANGAMVGNQFTVEGTAVPGAMVVVRAQPRLMGNTVQQQTTADRAGHWRALLNVSSIPFVSFPYVVSAVEIVNGMQSDMSSIEVTVH